MMRGWQVDDEKLISTLVSCDYDCVRAVDALCP
jgi:hypothetical protein